MSAVSFMLRDRLSKKDVAGVLSGFQATADEDGWTFPIGNGYTDMAVEIGDNNGLKAIPPAMVKQSARALGIQFGKPKTRLVVMWFQDEDDFLWSWVFRLARAFNERWRVVVLSHTSVLYTDLTPRGMPA